MSSKVLHPLRQKCLHGVHGKVLEIGFGTGLNLPFYSKDVVEVHAVDVNPKMAPKALQRIEEKTISCSASCALRRILAHGR